MADKKLQVIPLGGLGDFGMNSHAIRYGDDPQRRASLLEKVEGALDSKHLKQVIERKHSSCSVCSMTLQMPRALRLKVSTPVGG